MVSDNFLKIRKIDRLNYSEERATWALIIEAEPLNKIICPLVINCKLVMTLNG